MAYRHYLVYGTGKQLDRLSARITSVIGDQSGDPLVAIGATRALVSAGVAQQLGAAMPGKDPKQVLHSMGATRVEPLKGDTQVPDLMKFREPTEFSIERTVASQDLVQDGYDWHLVRTHIVEAWDLIGGPENVDWGDIRVGQIDTGYTEHPALGWRNHQSTVVRTDLDRNFFYLDVPDNSESPPWEVPDSWSGVDPLSGGSFDGHGTRTGTLLTGFDQSAKARITPGDNPKPVKGFFGAAPKVPYVPVRISDSVFINHVTGGLRDAINWLTVDAGCRVLSLSMGVGLPAYIRNDVRQAIDRAYENGVIFCCAAGNVVRSVVAPARYPRTVAVAGCTPADVPWSGSSCGMEVDVAAPAWPIRRGNTTRSGKFEYGYGDGTSFATPLVAGAAAMWLAKHRDDLEARYPEPWMRVEAFIKLLRNTAQKPEDWDTALYGKGILNAVELLKADLPASDSLVKDIRAAD